MLRIFVSVLLAVGLVGCASLNGRDRDFLTGHGVGGALYEKMSHHEVLTLDDIMALSRKGVPGPFIVHYLRPTYYVYKLSYSDVSDLRKAGVDGGVVSYLLATPHLYSPAYAPPGYTESPNFYDTHPGFDIY